MKAEWFVASTEAYLGPYTQEQLRDLYAAGKFAPGSMAHRTGEAGRPISTLVGGGPPIYPGAAPERTTGTPPLPPPYPPIPQSRGVPRREPTPARAEPVRAASSASTPRRKISKSLNAVMMGISIVLGGVVAMFVARLVLPAFRPDDSDEVVAPAVAPRRNAATESSSPAWWKSETKATPPTNAPSNSAATLPVVSSDSFPEPTTSATGGPAERAMPSPQPGFSEAPRPRPQPGFSVAPTMRPEPGFSVAPKPAASATATPTSTRTEPPTSP